MIEWIEKAVLQVTRRRLQELTYGGNNFVFTINLFLGRDLSI